MIELNSIIKTFNRTVILDRLSWNLEEGRMVGLFGMNGSGKSTLLKLIAGLASPDGGTLTVDGMKPGVQTKRMVAYLPDADGFYPWMTARDLLGYMEDAYPDWDPAKAKELLRRFDISLQSPLGTQSKGSLAKLKLILALSRNAKYILLDEPLLGIDPLTKRDLIGLVLREFKEDWQTVVMATHDIYDLEQLFDEVAFLAKGQIKATARPEQLREEGKGAMSWIEEVHRL